MNTLDRILGVLKENNLTQKDLTDFLGLQKGAFTQWKLGKNTSYIKHLPKISEFLNVSLDYLLGKTDQVENIKKSGLKIKANTVTVESFKSDKKAILNNISIDSGSYRILRMMAKQKETTLENFIDFFLFEAIEQIIEEETQG